MTVDLPIRASGGSAKAKIYSAGSITTALAWTNIGTALVLARGHEQGVTVFRYSGRALQELIELPVGSGTTALGAASDYNSLYVVSAHADNSVGTHKIGMDGSVVFTLELSGTSGHAAPVTVAAVTVVEGMLLTATASEDCLFIVSSYADSGELALVRSYRIANVKQAVFVPGQAKFAVLDGESRVRILDCGTGQWLLSVYCGRAQTISVLPGSKGAAIAAFEENAWRIYRGITFPGDETAPLRGGSGHTYAAQSGVLRRRDEASTTTISMAAAAGYLAKISKESVSLFDIESGSEFGLEVPVRFTTTEVRVAAVAVDGSVAVACGTEIYVVSDREVEYENDNDDSVLYDDRPRQLEQF